MDKLKSFTDFSFFGNNKKDVLPTNPAPLYPIWKIHKYNGVHLKPVPLSSIPYAKVSVATPSTSAPKKSQVLPSLEQVKLILGTTSDTETINALKELASTRNGLEMIAGFIKANIANANLNSEKMSEEIDAAVDQFSALTESEAEHSSIDSDPQNGGEKHIPVHQKVFDSIQMGADQIKSKLPFKIPVSKYGPPNVYGPPNNPPSETYSVPKMPVIEPSSDSSAMLADGNKIPKTPIPIHIYAAPAISDSGSSVTESAVIPSTNYGVPMIPYYEIQKFEDGLHNIAPLRPTTHKYTPDHLGHADGKQSAHKYIAPSPIYSLASRSQITNQELPLLEVPSASSEEIKPIFHETTSTKKHIVPTKEYGPPKTVEFKPIVVPSDSQDGVFNHMDVSNEKYGLPIHNDQSSNFASATIPTPVKPKIIYGEPKPEKIPTNAERTMEKFIPFPILPELPSLPEAENLPEFQSLPHFGKPVFSFSSGPISYTSNTKVLNPDQIKRRVYQTKFEQPGFSYSQLSKIPLDEGVHFKRTPGQVSSFGEPVPAYVFDDEKESAPTENKSVSVKSSIKVGSKKEIANNKIDVSIYNNPARRRWMPKTKRDE